MKPIKNVKKSDANSKTSENSSSDIKALLNKLRKKGITAILTMNKRAQITMSNWAHDLLNQYNAVLKNNPMKLKDIKELPCSKMDVKLAVKLLLLASVEKGSEDNTVVDLRDKFVSLGAFQSIDQEDTIKLMKYITNIQKISLDAETPPLPEAKEYMDLIISEQKALLEEINSFIMDLRKMKKRL